MDNLPITSSRLVFVFTLSREKDSHRCPSCFTIGTNALTTLFATTLLIIATKRREARFFLSAEDGPLLWRLTNKSATPPIAGTARLQDFTAHIAVERERCGNSLILYVTVGPPTAELLLSNLCFKMVAVGFNEWVIFRNFY